MATVKEIQYKHCCFCKEKIVMVFAVAILNNPNGAVR